MFGRVSCLTLVNGPSAGCGYKVIGTAPLYGNRSHGHCAMSEAPLCSVAAESKMRSPRITALAWGKIEVEGVGILRDAKLFPGGAREWDWDETGTEHIPGIQPTDVRELLDHGATTIVLSQGMLNRLGICSETLELLKQQGVVVHVLPTQDAVDLYNELRKTEQVAGLFHTTC